MQQVGTGLAAAPLGPLTSLEIPRSSEQCGGSQQHGEGMRNQDLAGRKLAAEAKKKTTPVLLHHSACPVLGRDDRGVMGTPWGQPCCWWPLSIPSFSIILPSPPAPSNAGFQRLQGGGGTQDRLCQSTFLGS